ncbi:hypothetical protein DWB78_12325 [Halopelagius longus]|uniref:Uncharacterized protein n=1 Tax=Halopelagius longus TaxID=1236180 RepID=A0A370INZ1_9EURY|nr:hypothetical protein DWB78_12325 [Halopelagius longus]
MDLVGSSNGYLDDLPLRRLIPCNLINCPIVEFDRSWHVPLSTTSTCLVVTTSHLASVSRLIPIVIIATGVTITIWSLLGFTFGVSGGLRACSLFFVEVLEWKSMNLDDSSQSRRCMISRWAVDAQDISPL